MKFCIKGLGAIGPGYADWAGFQAALNTGALSGTETPAPEPKSISRRERARAPYLVKLAIAAAEQAAEMSGYEPAEMASVFSSCMSDTEVTDYMCRTLADDPTEMSPTKFHNSVHNAAAGYWTISNKAHMPATAISAGSQYSVATALVEAAAQCDQEKVPVLLVIYDVVVPDVLKCVLDIERSAAFSMVLSPELHAPGSVATVELKPDAADNSVSSAEGASVLMFGNPIFRIIPLLERLADKAVVELSLPLSEEISVSLKTI